MRDDAFRKYPSKDFLNKPAHTWEETANPHMVELPYPGVNLMRHLNTHSACQTPNFVAKLQQKVKVSQTLTWTFTFLVGIFAISSELSHFLYWGDQFHT